MSIPPLLNRFRDFFGFFSEDLAHITVTILTVVVGKPMVKEVRPEKILGSNLKISS